VPSKICAFKQGRLHEFEGGAVNALDGGWGGEVNTVNTLKFEKGGGCMTPQSPMVAPPLPSN